MTEITLNISDNRLNTFIEFIKTLSYVEIQEPSNTEEETLNELENSFKQVKDMRNGKIIKQTAKDFLDVL